MFERLFAESGLSLDRLRALVEVGSHGSIVKAAQNDPVRQSQFSRQIKELEDFFQATLVERYGKGVRLTTQGRELARISRFFLLGLSNFQRGCVKAGQFYRVGGGATFVRRFLLRALADLRAREPGLTFSAVTIFDEDDIERRLHDLTLDFGVLTRHSITRPLQMERIAAFRLRLWIPKALCKSASEAERLFQQGRLPLILPARELTAVLPCGRDRESAMECDSFADAAEALRGRKLAAILPEFLSPERPQDFVHADLSPFEQNPLAYNLAWNPRMLRLNPQAARRRDKLLVLLRKC